MNKTFPNGERINGLWWVTNETYIGILGPSGRAIESTTLLTKLLFFIDIEAFDMAINDIVGNPPSNQ